MGEKRTILLVLFAMVVGGCVTLTPEQERLYDELVAREEPIAPYPDPILSGIFSILPGGGQIMNGQVSLGILNGLLWPWSVVWAMPSAIVDATTIRKIMSVKHYVNKRSEETDPWDTRAPDPSSWESPVESGRRGRLLSNKEIERRRRLWSDARSRRWVLSRNEIQRRRSQWVEAQRAIFSKRAHVTLDLTYVLFQPFLEIGRTRDNIFVGPGASIGMHVPAGEIFWRVDVDIRLGVGRNSTWGCWDASLGPTVGIGKQLAPPFLELVVFFRPAICLTGIRHLHGSGVGDTESGGARFDFGFGFRPTPRFGVELKASLTVHAHRVPVYPLKSTLFSASYSFGFAFRF